MSRTLKNPLLALGLIVIQLAEKASCVRKNGNRNDCKTDKVVSYWRQILATTVTFYIDPRVVYEKKPRRRSTDAKR